MYMSYNVVLKRLVIVMEFCFSIVHAESLLDRYIYANLFSVEKYQHNYRLVKLLFMKTCIS